jgi:hypothetical protein
MMPNVVKQFPREYSGGQSPTQYDTQVVEGVPEVVALWSEYTGQEIRSQTWVFRRKVLAVARKYMRGFFLKQDRNEELQDYNYDFLIDTLRFIVEGRRHIGVFSWLQLVNHQPAKAMDVSERSGIRDYLKQHDLLDMSFDEMIQKWCSHPGGVDDMMVSLNVIFGDVTKTVR